MNLCKTYIGGQPVKARDMFVGPISRIATAGSIQVEVVTGSGVVGEYGFQISDTDNEYCTLFTRNKTGIALFIVGAPVLFHRLALTKLPDPGTTVRVCLVVDDD